MFFPLSVWLGDQWQLWAAVTIEKKKTRTQHFDCYSAAWISSSSPYMSLGVPLFTSLFSALHLNSTNIDTFELQQWVTACHHIRATCIDVSQDGKMDKNTNNLATVHSVLYMHSCWSDMWRNILPDMHSSTFRCHWTTYMCLCIYNALSPQFVPMHCLLRLVVVVLRFVFHHIEFSRSGNKSVLAL